MIDPVITRISSKRLIFPLIVGRNVDGQFHRVAYAGTGFFVGMRGLAMTAHHVLNAAKEGDLVHAALPCDGGAMKAYRLEWSAQLPNSDIAVFRVNVPRSACMRVTFRDLNLGDDVHTTGIADCMFETDTNGKSEIRQRTIKGYVAHGARKWLAASFPLPLGMSGSPAVFTVEKFDEVVGVFVSQMRGEIVENQVTEVTETIDGGKSTFVEKVARVEYEARIEALSHHKDYKGPEFEGLTLAELIARETPQ